MTTLGRLELMRTSKPTVILCTPSYALHLAEVGSEHQLDVGNLGVRWLILAGEAGGSVPATRARIEAAWQALGKEFPPKKIIRPRHSDRPHKAFQMRLQIRRSRRKLGGVNCSRLT